MPPTTFEHPWAFVVFYSLNGLALGLLIHFAVVAVALAAAWFMGLLKSA